MYYQKGHYNNTYNDFTYNNFTYNDNAHSSAIQLASFLFTFFTAISKVIYKYKEGHYK